MIPTEHAFGNGDPSRPYATAGKVVDALRRSLPQRITTKEGHPALASMNFSQRALAQALRDKGISISEPELSEFLSGKLLPKKGDLEKLYHGLVEVLEMSAEDAELFGIVIGYDYSFKRLGPLIANSAYEQATVPLEQLQRRYASLVNGK